MGRYFKPPPLPCPVCGVFCTAKYRGGSRKDRGVKKQYSNVVVRFLYSSPAVSHSIAECHKKQRGKKAAFQSSSPVFCTAKYRGGGRRTEGLENTDSGSDRVTPPLPPLCSQRNRGSTRRVREINPYSQKILYTIFFNHSPRRYRSSVSLLYGSATQVRRSNTLCIEI